MRGPGFKERIRRDVLGKHNLERTGKGHIGAIPTPPPDPRKTLIMRLLEDKHGLPMEELLLMGDLEEVGEMLGVDQSTISKWRKRLGLRIDA